MVHHVVEGQGRGNICNKFRIVSELFGFAMRKFCKSNSAMVRKQLPRKSKRLLRKPEQLPCKPHQLQDDPKQLRNNSKFAFTKSVILVGFGDYAPGPHVSQIYVFFWFSQWFCYALGQASLVILFFWVFSMVLLAGLPRAS